MSGKEGPRGPGTGERGARGSRAFPLTRDAQRGPLQQTPGRPLALGRPTPSGLSRARSPAGGRRIGRRGEATAGLWGRGLIPQRAVDAPERRCFLRVQVFGGDSGNPAQGVRAASAAPLACAAAEETCVFRAWDGPMWRGHSPRFVSAPWKPPRPQAGCCSGKPRGRHRAAAGPPRSLSSRTSGAALAACGGPSSSALAGNLGWSCGSS